MRNHRGQTSHRIDVALLQMWQSGSRKDSADAMADIAKRLGDQDMAAVAAYYQQLREAPAQAAK